MRSSRRDALKALGVTVAVATLGGAEALARASTGAELAAKPADQASQGLGKKAKKAAQAKKPDSFAGLKGAQFANATVDSVGAVEHGSVSVNFVDAHGQPFTVDVLRHDAASPGVARAGSLAVFMKAGAAARGQKATLEEHGLAAMALAAELARREEVGASVPALLTLKERAVARRAWNVRDVQLRVS